MGRFFKQLKKWKVVLNKSKDRSLTRGEQKAPTPFAKKSNLLTFFYKINKGNFAFFCYRILLPENGVGIARVHLVPAPKK